MPHAACDMLGEKKYRLVHTYSLGGDLKGTLQSAGCIYSTLVLTQLGCNDSTRKSFWTHLKYFCQNLNSDQKFIDFGSTDLFLENVKQFDYIIYFI